MEHGLLSATAPKGGPDPAWEPPPAPGLSDARARAHGRSLRARGIPALPSRSTSTHHLSRTDKFLITF